MLAAAMLFAAHLRLRFGWVSLVSLLVATGRNNAVVLRAAVRPSSSRHGGPDLNMHAPKSEPRFDVVGYGGLPDLPCGEWNHLPADAAMGDDASPPSFAVLARVYGGELPYLSSFVRHYSQLGVRAFYLLNNMYDQHDEIIAFLRSIGNDRICLRLKSYQNANEEYSTSSTLLKDSSLLKGFRETFLISVDIDEYWVLPQSMNLSTYVNLHPGDLYFMHWLMVPNDGLAGALHTPYLGHVGHRGKWMARASKLWDLRINEPELVKPYTQVGDSYKHLPDTSGTLLHFWGRSFQDIAAKAYSQSGILKSKGFDNTRADIAKGRLPERLQLLAFLMIESSRDNATTCRPPNCWIVETKTDALQVDEELQARNVATSLQVKAEVASQHLREIKDLYESYKQNLALQFDKAEQPAGYPSEITLNDVSTWLQNHEPPRVVSLRATN